MIAPIQSNCVLYILLCSDCFVAEIQLCLTKNQGTYDYFWFRHTWIGGNHEPKIMIASNPVSCMFSSVLFILFFSTAVTGMNVRVLMNTVTSVQKRL